jgi:hypothetical protein
VHFSTKWYLIAAVRFTEVPVSIGGWVVAVYLQLRAISRVTDVTGACDLQIASALGAKRSEWPSGATTPARTSS